MKTAIVLSDTHGQLFAVSKLDEIMRETDYIFHLGDYVRDIDDFRRRYPNKTHVILGNCDGGHGYNTIEIEGVKILYTHGHDYAVKDDLLALSFKAMEEGAKVVFYGHTHTPNVTKEGEITFVNPGALSSENKTYAYLVFSDKKFSVTIQKLY